LESSGIQKERQPEEDVAKEIEDEIRSIRRSWREVKGVAEDRNAWKLFMDSPCSTRSKRI
jgi:hypothetical protein